MLSLRLEQTSIQTCLYTRFVFAFLKTRLVESLGMTSHPSFYHRVSRQDHLLSLCLNIFAVPGQFFLYFFDNFD